MSTRGSLTYLVFIRYTVIAIVASASVIKIIAWLQYMMSLSCGNLCHGIPTSLKHINLQIATMPQPTIALVYDMLQIVYFEFWIVWDFQKLGQYTLNATWLWHMHMRVNILQ